MSQEDLSAPDPTDVGSRSSPLALVLFAVIALLIAADLVADYGEGTTPSHLVSEGVVMVLALVGVAALWEQVVSSRRRTAA